MPTFTGTITHASGGVIITSTGGQHQGFGIYDDISARDAVPSGSKDETTRCNGFIAVVVNADGAGARKLFIYSGVNGNPNDWDDYIQTSDWEDTANWDEIATGTGADGADGNTIHNGGSVPSAVVGAQAGDFYIDTVSDNIYGPVSIDESAVQTWGSAISMAGGVGLTGADGIQGETGPTGPAGSSADLDISALSAVTDPVNGDSLAELVAGGQLAAYVTDQENVKISFSDLTAALGVQLAQDNIDSGFGSITSYSGINSGMLGDFNNDSVIGSADLIMFLTMYDSFTTVVPSFLTFSSLSPVNIHNVLIEDSADQYSTGDKIFFILDGDGAGTSTVGGTIPFTISNVDTADWLTFNNPGAPIQNGDWDMSNAIFMDLVFETNWPDWYCPQSDGHYDFNVKMEVTLLDDNAASLLGHSPIDIVLFSADSDPISVGGQSIFNTHINNASGHVSGSDVLASVVTAYGLTWPISDLDAIKVRVFIDATTANVTIQPGAFTVKYKSAN